MMRAPQFACFFLCGLVYTGAAPIEKEDTAAKMIEALGEPMGTIEMSDKTLFLYPQGEVTVKAGVISDFDLLESDEFLAEQERQRIEREEWQADQERRHALRLEEGKALKREKMQSQAFARLPAKNRVDYWRHFQACFPGIDISEQLASALEGYETELAELRSQERISKLETRVAQAEREAAAARLEAEKLRKETQQLKRSRYGLRYYTDPLPHPRHGYYRPPTVTIHTNGRTTRTTHDGNIFRFHHKSNTPAVNVTETRH